MSGMTLEQVRDCLRNECAAVEKDEFRQPEVAYQVPSDVLDELADAVESTIAELATKDSEIARLRELLADANRGAQRNAKVAQSLADRVVKLIAKCDAWRTLVLEHNARCTDRCRNCRTTCPDCPDQYGIDIPHELERTNDGGAE